MTQKKTLPYKIPSVMLTYPYNAFYFGILETNKFYRNSIENILINDFTELYFYKSGKKVK